MPGRSVKKGLISANEWSTAVLPLLEEGHCLKIPVEGLSMYPLLVGGRDSVIISSITKKPQRSDIVLFVRKDGTHVLHRIHSTKNNMYYMLGDSQTWIEGPIERNVIIAIARTIIRKGHPIQLDNFIFRSFSILWILLRPVRPLLLRIMKIAVKIYRKLQATIEHLQ